MVTRGTIIQIKLSQTDEHWKVGEIAGIFSRQGNVWAVGPASPQNLAIQSTEKLIVLLSTS